MKNIILNPNCAAFLKEPKGTVALYILYRDEMKECAKIQRNIKSAAVKPNKKRGVRTFVARTSIEIPVKDPIAMQRLLLWLN